MGFASPQIPRYETPAHILWAYRKDGPHVFLGVVRTLSGCQFNPGSRDLPFSGHCPALVVFASDGRELGFGVLPMVRYRGTSVSGVTCGAPSRDYTILVGFEPPVFCGGVSIRLMHCVLTFVYRTRSVYRYKGSPCVRSYVVLLPSVE